ncbi:MAG: DUF58 domain-containing protein [Actinomycetales bacterium]|nr:DUF58 domain-containing protein [Actinomycetales bacterium]
MTARGRAVLVVGLLLAGVGWGLGQPPVIGVAAILFVLPLVGLISVRRSRYRLGAVRTVDPEQFAVGETAEVRLLVENDSLLPTGSLLLRDEVSEALGEPTRLLLDRIPSRAQRIVRYPVIGQTRGRTRVGPLSVTAVDPFGMARLTRSFTESNHVLVTPRIVPLGAVPTARMVGGHGESQSRSIATRGEDDSLPREHQPGDDMRRIHWRATAKSGELMVRREERAWRATATVVLDDRAHAHHGRGAASTFEWAVSAAASIAVHYFEHGWRVQAVTTTGRALVHVGVGAPGELELLLESFADAELHDAPWGKIGQGAAVPAAIGSRIDPGIGPDATAVVAVMGDLADDPAVLLPARGSGFAGCLAYDPHGTDAAASTMRARGWRVGAWSSTTDVAEAWRRIAPSSSSPLGAVPVGGAAP